jgi:hypothetical protein
MFVSFRKKDFAMKDYLTEVNTLFPIRKRENQKSAFRDYVTKEAKASGWHTRVECLGGRHNNVVIGDPTKAKTVLTAHYDTPASSLIPNLMLPRNPLITYLYVFFFAFAVAFFSLFIASAISIPFGLGYKVRMAIYLLIFLVLYFCLLLHGENKHNINDNTSGVASVLSVMERCSPSDDVAFILFDNEEKGLLGSKAYQKAHANDLEQTLILNLDCVGNGSHILFVAKKDAEISAEYARLKETLQDQNGYHLHYFPMRGSIGNSDYKSFKRGVGIMACKKNAMFGYYTNKIHTRRDTVSKTENIEYLADQLSVYLHQ